MTTTVKISLEEYYTNLYGKPKNDTEAIQTLLQVYKQKLKLTSMSDEVVTGISEYYRMLQYKNLPAYTWLLEAFHLVSKKNIGKQNFPYVVGMIRQWMVNGFGYMPQEQDQEVLSYFLDVTSLPEASPEAKKTILNLMANYGVVKLTRAIGDFNQEGVDISKVFADILGTTIRNKFGVPVPVYDNGTSKAQYNNEVALQTIPSTTQNATENKRFTVEEFKNQVANESKVVLKYLTLNSKPQKLSDIMEATKSDIEWGVNPSSKMITFMKGNKGIIRAGRGYFTMSIM